MYRYLPREHMITPPQETIIILIQMFSNEKTIHNLALPLSSPPLLPLVHVFGVR